MISVSEVMCRDLVTLRESDTLDTADELLNLGHIRHLPVVRGKKLVGIITHRDLLRHCHRRDAQGQPVEAGSVMVRDPVTIGPEASLLSAIRLILDNRFGCLPVINENGTLVGIVTESDLLRVAAERVEELDRQQLAAEYTADA